MWDGLDKGRVDDVLGGEQHDGCLGCTALAVQVAAADGDICRNCPRLWWNGRKERLNG